MGPIDWCFILFDDPEASQVDPFNILLRLYRRHHPRGNVNDVSRDVGLFKSEGEAIGLVLNISV